MPENILNVEEAMEILDVNKSRGFPLHECKNVSRGCKVKTYPRIISLHEDMCKFPEIKKLSVRSKLNFFKAHEEKFNIFCQAFDKSRNVLFLYKKTKEKDSIKICVQNYGKENTFTITFYDKKDRHIHKLAGKTGLKIHLIPAKVFKEVGPMVKYKIQMDM